MAHAVLGAGQPIDFKVADAAADPLPLVTQETGMDRLSVRACKVRHRPRGDRVSTTQLA
jgi:hypothetical protein